ncbi:spirocyclase, AveC family [Mycobacterium eburneum]|nr:spirocyclase AveC family protein [Mycobacterium eburneum]TDH57002.1 spirocyclase, AveC family [Mycobacterium eburneum]
MTAEQTVSSATSVDTPKRGSPWAGLGIVAALAVGFAFAYCARVGAVSDRIRNPEVSGAPRPVAPLFGFQHWLGVLQAFTIVTMVIIIAVYVVAWRRHPYHPALLMGIVTTLIVWQDPIMNWSPYAVYNPQLYHLPEDWPLVSLSPTVEPFLVLGYIMFYLGPYFPAIWILRRIQARSPVDSFVWRHPLISLAVIILPIGIVLDAALEMTLVRTGMYIYSQVIPFGSAFVGETYQFPFIVEVLVVNLVMVPAGVLLYRDDTGRTVAEKLAQRARIFATRPTLGMFVVMLALINVGYFCYGGTFALIKMSHVATSVACPWPYPEAKVYDPQGFYERNGQPGPYSVGKWSTWLSGQPNGRPDVQVAADGTRCKPVHG